MLPKSGHSFVSCHCGLVKFDMCYFIHSVAAAATTTTTITNNVTISSIFTKI